jgi:hypothetical protein
MTEKRSIKWKHNNNNNQQIVTAIYIYTPDESSTKEMLETDNELLDEYKIKKVQQ